MTSKHYWLVNRTRLIDYSVTPPNIITKIIRAKIKNQKKKINKKKIWFSWQVALLSLRFHLPLSQLWKRHTLNESCHTVLCSPKIVTGNG